MATSGIVSAVARRWWFPVTSMRGERLAQAERTRGDLVGDRAYARIDTDTEKVVSVLRPQRHFDERRFQMNVIVGANEAGFVENDGIGLELVIGEAVRPGVALPDPRCVRTTLAHDELLKDTDILRTRTRHNRVEVGGVGLFPCAGASAVVAAPGTIRTGDRVART